MRRLRLISFFMILMFLLTFGVSAKTDRATFEIKLPDELPQKGDTFEVSIEISDNPGFAAVEFTLTYDRDSMTCDDAYLDGVLSRAVGVTNPESEDGAVIAAVSMKTISDDGLLAVVTFIADEDIEEFDFELEDVVLADSDLNDIDYIVSGGKTDKKDPPVLEDETDTEDKETDESVTNPEEDKPKDDSDEEADDKDFADEPDKEDINDKPSEKEPEDEPADKDSDDKTTDKEQIDDSEDTEDKITDKEESDSDNSKDKTDDKNSDDETSDKDDTESGKESADKKDDDTSNDKESSDKIETKPTPDDKEKDPVREYNFSDVVGHWSEQYVINAAKLGLFIGDTDGNFRPDDNVTRAQFVTVLWRMAGKEHVDVKTPFKDIENELPEFKEAINWAYAKGYINGISETEFAPSSPITREAGMKILHYYSGGQIGMEIQFYPIYDGILKDSKEISSWAKPSVYWGIYNKLISGMTEDTMLPKGNATRAQLAKILVNYLEIDE